MSVYSVTVYPSSTTIKTGAWYYGAYAVVNACSNCCRDVEWYSDTPSVATVNPIMGYIYGMNPGTAKIYARSKIDSSKKDYITVTVTSGSICVECVQLNKTSISLEKGDCFTLTATVCPTNATNKAIHWRSTNESVATVSGGVVTAKASGETYIYAEATDGSGVYGSCYVRVTENILVSSVTVDPPEKAMVVGETYCLREAVCPPNATDPRVVWESSDECVVTVNPASGMVYAQGVGQAVVTATPLDGGADPGECLLTVNPPIAVTCVQVSPTSLTMNVGDTEPLFATVYPCDATNKQVIWSSSNENVAHVNAFTGVVVANMAGEATITATTVDGGYTASCTVSVCQVLSYPDTLITHTPTQNAIIQLKNLRDETLLAYLYGTINSNAMEIATQRIDYEINLARADYIAVGTNPFSEYAYAILGGDITAAVPCSFSRSLYYRAEDPFAGLDVMVVQRVLELYGYYEHDTNVLYGIWDQATQDAALSWKPLLTPTDGQRVFDSLSFNVLFQNANISKRTYEAMRLIQQFNLQHKMVQLQCQGSLGLGGMISRIEMPVKGSGMSGGTGRADVVGKTTGGTYVWEVKHNTPSAIMAGEAQIQRYISASQSVYDQPAFYPQNLNSPYKLPLIAGPAVFSPTAIPWFDKYLLYRSCTSINPYENALVVYEESDYVPEEYAYAPHPVAISVPLPEENYSFNLNRVYNAVTNFGNAIVSSVNIDPLSGEFLVSTFIPTLGVVCVLTLGMLIAMALV